MAVANKIILNNEIILDLTNDTVSESDVLEGKIFHKADGTVGVGTLVPTNILEPQDRYSVLEVGELPLNPIAEKIYLCKGVYYMPAYNRYNESLSLYACQELQDEAGQTVLIPYFTIGEFELNGNGLVSGSLSIPPEYDGVNVINYTAPNDKLNTRTVFTTPEQLWGFIKNAPVGSLFQYGGGQGVATGTYTGDVGANILGKIRLDNTEEGIFVLTHTAETKFENAIEVVQSYTYELIQIGKE